MSAYHIASLLSENASFFESGDHVGSDAPVESDVSCVASPPSSEMR